MKLDAVGEDALSCLIVLLRAPSSAGLLSVLPEERRKAVEEKCGTLTRASKDEVLDTFRKARQADVAAAMSRARVTDAAAWTSLPAPLQQWLSNRGQDANG
jgi:hypothetical protein